MDTYVRETLCCMIGYLLSRICADEWWQFFPSDTIHLKTLLIFSWLLAFRATWVFHQHVTMSEDFILLLLLPRTNTMKPSFPFKEDDNMWYFFITPCIMYTCMYFLYCSVWCIRICWSRWKLSSDLQTDNCHIP